MVILKKFVEAFMASTAGNVYMNLIRCLLNKLYKIVY